MPVGNGAEAPNAQSWGGSDVVEVINPTGRGDFVIVCEHASNAIPSELQDLGLSGDVLHSHIAWDPGARAVAEAMAKRLDSPMVAQRVSRLVYDCNRACDEPSAIPHHSEIYAIPGNVDLSPGECRVRVERYYIPFRDALNAILDARVAQGHAPVLVTIHSFTPVYHGVKRDLEVGILHDDDARFADALLDVAAGHPDMVVRRNAPYEPKDGVTYTLVEHAAPRGLLNAMLEIRNDLIRTPEQQQAFAELLTGWVETAAASLATEIKREVK